jgi:hypothetical protein
VRLLVVTMVAAAVLSGCGFSDNQAETSPASPSTAAAGEPVDASGTTGPVDAVTRSPAFGAGTHLPPLSTRQIDDVLLVERDLPADFHADPSASRVTGAPPVTRGPSACRLVSQALSTSYRHGASAIRLRGFTVGNRGPAVIEGVAAFPHGARGPLTALKAGFARCPGYQVGKGRLSTTYVAEPYDVGRVADGHAGVMLTGSFPDVSDYIVIRVVTASVGDNLVMVCTFGVLGNGISDRAFTRVVRTAIGRVARAR